MTRSWALLAAAVVLAALALAAASRLPRPRPAAPPAPAPAPLASLALEIRDGTVSPELVTYRLGTRLAVTYVNRGRAAVRVALAGYEGQRPERTLEPGGSRTDTLRLDLPGEDFAWRLDGEPVGRLRVAGSHLVAGHR